MKRIIIIAFSMFLTNFIFAKQKGSVTIVLGAWSTDGSGIKGISWGAGCKSETGICLKINSVAMNTAGLTVTSDKEVQLEIADTKLLNELKATFPNNIVEFPGNSEISNDITNNYDDLEKNGYYFIPAGSYEINYENGIAIIKLTISNK
jgi:hypothetical protein